MFISAPYKYTTVWCVVECLDFIERMWVELISPQYAATPPQTKFTVRNEKISVDIEKKAKSNILLER